MGLRLNPYLFLILASLLYDVCVSALSPGVPTASAGIAPKIRLAATRPTAASEELAAQLALKDDDSDEALLLVYAHKLPGREETVLDLFDYGGDWRVERLDRDTYLVSCDGVYFEADVAAKTVRPGIISSDF